MREGNIFKEVGNQVACALSGLSLEIDFVHKSWMFSSSFYISIAEYRAENISIKRHGEGSAE